MLLLHVGYGGGSCIRHFAANSLLLKIKGNTGKGDSARPVAGMTRGCKMNILPDVKKYMAGSVMLAALAAAPFQQAQATNGMVPHGHGAQSKAMSGAGVALALDTQAGVNNPAAMVLLGNRLDLELEFFAPVRDFTASAGGPLTAGKTKSATEFFLIPAMGANWMIDDKSSIGVTMTPAGGMNTDYQAAVYAGFGAGSAPTGVDLAQVMLGVTYAREIIPGQRIGITPVLAAQRFRAEGLEAFRGASLDPGSVTNNGYDHSVGYGFRIGWQGDFFKNFTIGASYQSRMWMTEFTKYEGLFAEQGDFDFAPISNLGIAWRATPALTFALDWQHIFYNEIDAIANNGNVPLVPGVLGGDDGAGFGWEDMDVVKFGVKWQTNEALTLFTGISHNTQTFNDDQILFNILAPGVVRTHASVGASYQFNKTHAVNFSFTRAFSSDITGGSVNLGPVQTVRLRMDQYDGVIGYAYTW